MKIEMSPTEFWINVYFARVGPGHPTRTQADEADLYNERLGVIHFVDGTVTYEANETPRQT